MNMRADLERLCKLVERGEEHRILEFARALARRDDGAGAVQLIQLAAAIHDSGGPSELLTRAVARVLSENFEACESSARMSRAARALWAFEDRETPWSKPDPAPPQSISVANLLSSLPRRRVL